MENSFNPFPITILALFIFLYIVLCISRKKGHKKLPPAPGRGLPVLGHVHLLERSKPVHLSLGEMADKYGPIFTMKLGLRRFVVVSNWEIAKECLTTNDKVFANRPKSLATKILGYDYAMITFSPYGPYWRQMRKITTLELLSNRRLDALKDSRETLVQSSIKELYKLSVVVSKSTPMDLVDMSKWFGEVAITVIMNIIVGKSSKSAEWRRTLKEFIELSGTLAVSDMLPLLGWFDIGGYEKAMKKVARDMEHVFKEWLEEHKRKRELSGKVKVEEDFMDVMLSILDDAQDFPDYDADTINKATCLAMILAATDTTSVTLTWALSLLLNHGDVLKQAQQELETLVGKEKQVKESDIRNLVYLPAILKETLRLYPPVPLLVPHESTEDCTVGGYHIPAGTMLFANLWKIQTDPRVWTDPHEFKPERFLTTHKDMDLRGQNFELMPFSSGRRMCPGVSFALQIMQLTLAKLLHGFDFKTPSGEAIDMQAGLGLAYHKASPVKIILTPRLPAHLYG